MMKRTMLAALAVAVIGLFGPPDAQAQDYPDYRFDIGIFGGGSWYSAMLDDEHLTTADDDVRYKAGWVTGAQATLWITPRFGIRANGAYTERPVTGGLDSQQNEDDNLVDDVNLWSMSGDLMIHLTSEPMGGIGMPYIALGAGAKNVNPAQDLVLPLVDGEEIETGAIMRPEPGNDFYLEESYTLMGLAAIGTDIRLADRFALRVEVGDRFWDSRTFDAATYEQNPDEDTGNVIHEIYGQLGAHVLFGLSEPDVVAVTPPPPAPAPEPEPEPEPEPVEEAIMVCVIDPSAENGLVEMEAIYLPETRDTLVERMGQREAFATVVPDVMLAEEADWFVAGEPLTFTYNGTTVEYQTWQSARMIEADQLTYLGTSRGLPVYAATDDVMDIRADWMDAREAAATGDLDDILEENAELARELEQVQYLYVPLRPTGCVFQTVRVVEQVRKK